MGLTQYRRKRDFARTSEPAGNGAAAGGQGVFVVQRHAARRLHYDFRLELDGVLKSWAVPKGPSLDPEVKALAVQVEDHPLEYASFEGVIPAGQYGGGTVMLFDRGHWEPLGDPRQGYRRGVLKFRLHGQRLKGTWNLIRAGGRAADQDQWLLIKRGDRQARAGDGHRFVEQIGQSVATGRTMDDIARQADRVWPENDPSDVPDDPQGHGQQGSAQRKLAPEEAPAARRAPMPQELRPQLATLVTSPPAGEEWFHEVKYDGYRLIAFKDGNSTRLVTRRGNDWTDRFPTIAQAVQRLSARQLVLDGEAVVFARDGTTDFQALQNSLRAGGFKRHAYVLFDLIYCDGFDLSQTPLEARKQLLARLLQQHAGTGHVLRYSEHIQGRGGEVYQQACRHRAEGVISKRADSRYLVGRSKSWLKSKCRHRQELVVVGYTPPQGSRNHFGALLLGCYDTAGQLLYCGRVGTGFNERSLAEMAGELHSRHALRSPLAEPPAAGSTRGVQWVRPELVVEVEFAGWTDSHHIRQASFRGLREDKDPRTVHREKPARLDPDADPGPPAADLRNSDPARPRASRTGTARVAGVRITHPDKILYREQGVNKIQLARYYDEIADWILPHLVDRPLSIVRCPQGWQRKCFYQKHFAEGISAPIRSIRIEGDEGPEQYLGVDDRPGLVMLAQLGVLEIHPWGARNDRLDRPDRMIIDLDPGDAIDWSQMVEAAWRMRRQLEQLDLESFVRTTGGKGLHVVVPLERRSSWSEVKAFSRALAVTFARRWPEQFVATATRSRRAGKIYVDYLRNSRGATAVASYSTRARAGATVATPLGWHELNTVLQSDQYHVNSLPARLASLKSDPWRGFFSLRQSLTKTRLRAMGVELAR